VRYTVAMAKRGFTSLSTLFDNYTPAQSKGYVTKEFQDFGYRLALELNDLQHKSLYIKMAKQFPRGTLERALSFVSDAKEVKNKARLFMWKVKQLQVSHEKNI
jgi:hypothetical protein